MRTQIISEHGLGLPWLEYPPVKDGPPEQAILDKSPFVIGRGESADLQVVSHGVSREHATIVSEGRLCRIRDLGSTNGTFVNGQRIREADLRDGDMVQVANVELVFYVGKAPSRQTMVTQVLPPMPTPMATPLRTLATSRTICGVACGACTKCWFAVACQGVASRLSIFGRGIWPAMKSWTTRPCPPASGMIRCGRRFRAAWPRGFAICDGCAAWNRYGGGGRKIRLA